MNVTKELIKADPVKAAIALSKRAMAADPAQAKKMLVEKRRLLSKAVELRSDLLAIESDNAKTLDQQISALRQDIKTLISQLLPSMTTMPIFDLSCLDWRNDQGFPRLIPFAINDNKMRFVVRTQRLWRGGPMRTSNTGSKLPKRLSVHYKDVYKILRSLRKPNKSIEISATFDGAIPDDIRDLIQSARNVFDDLRIVAEVPTWTIVERNAQPARTRKGDPLLIGFDGTDYRLLAAFDTTSIEQLAMERSKGQRSS